jgi:hypothetical protein
MAALEKTRDILMNVLEGRQAGNGVNIINANDDKLLGEVYQFINSISNNNATTVDSAGKYLKDIHSNNAKNPE